jgi:hypothetical protein
LLSHCNNGCTKAPQRYITGTLPAFLNLIISSGSLKKQTDSQTDRKEQNYFCESNNFYPNQLIAHVWLNVQINQRVNKYPLLVLVLCRVDAK